MKKLIKKIEVNPNKIPMPLVLKKKKPRKHKKKLEALVTESSKEIRRNPITGMPVKGADKLCSASKLTKHELDMELATDETYTCNKLDEEFKESYFEIDSYMDDDEDESEDVEKSRDRI